MKKIRKIRGKEDEFGDNRTARHSHHPLISSVLSK